MKGCQSRSERSSVNRKLSKDEELGVYLYLKRLDEIGVPARLSMVSDCANSILQKYQAKDDINPAPTVSPAWSNFTDIDNVYVNKSKKSEKSGGKVIGHVWI